MSDIIKAKILTFSSASTDAKGLIRIATDEEALAGIDNTLAITPYTLKLVGEENYGTIIEMSVNEDYVLTLNLKNTNGDILSTQSVDFPNEYAITNIEYDETTHSLIFTLENGTTFVVPITGLQAEITSDSKLSSDLVDDNNKNNKFLSISQKELLDSLTVDSTELNSVEGITDNIQSQFNEHTGLIEEIDVRLSALGNTVSDNYITLDTKITNHIDNKLNPHNVTKLQIGLGNCDNTSDLDKPISTAQQNALNTLNGKIDGNTSIINEINTTLSALGSTVNIEITNRENGDVNLQRQIDAITSASDVTDIVGTYAQLQAYDTSTLPDKSIIKVLQDETQNDAITYYRWIIVSGTGSWNIIGQEGPYYTKSQSDLNYVPQTRTINNKALSNNISLDYSDINALSVNTTINDLTTTAQQNAINSTATKAKIDQIDTNTSMIQEINTTLSALGNSVDINTGAIVEINTRLSALGTASNYDATDFATASQGQKADTALQTITSNDVTNALGYTPYNSSNPNGYISSASIATLTDVTLSNLADGQNLIYDSATQKWKNKSSTATVAWGGLTGDIDDQTDLGNKFDTKQNKDTAVTHTASTAVGSATKGVYINSDGTTSEMTYSVEKSVPSNAVFTDTTYTFGTGSANGTIAVDGSDITVKGLGSAAYTSSSDYATSSQGTKADSALQSGDNVSELLNDAGYINGITSSDVTNALGYTPYNSNNPNGYQENVIETIKVNNTALTPSSKAVDINVPTDLGDLTNNAGYTKNAGTITGITMNGSSKGTSGVVDLGTVITSHQDISGKADDNLVVHLANTETITGNKTFSGSVSLGSSATATTPAITDNDTSVATTEFARKLSTHQPITTLTSGAITLTNGVSIYKRTVTAATTFSFSLSGTSASSDIAYTFELCIVMSTVYALTFPSSVTWQDGETPDMSSTGTYFLAFRTLDGGTTWLGNLQGKW